MAELSTLAPMKWVANYGGVAPTLDTSDSVNIGDVAIDSVTKTIWQCRDNTEGAPIWISGITELTWSLITASTKTMVEGEGYRADKTTLQTFTLPATCAVDKFIAITGVGTGLWKIAQNSGQQIHFGDIDTTSGVSGYMASTQRYDCVRLQCAVADTEFIVIHAAGNLEVT